MSTTACDEIREALTAFAECKGTLDGARIQTHCLFPSFDSVSVYVVPIGDGYRVHDDASAFSEAFLHGRDEAVISRALNHEALRYRIQIEKRVLFANVPSRDWLASAILSVANAAAAAAHSAVSKHVISHERALIDRIYDTLSERAADYRIVKEYAVNGKSGGERRFDFAVFGPKDETILINGVAPHHSSIYSKYVSFADIDLEQNHKFAVYDRKLETNDVALLQQVASIVPLVSLPIGTRNALVYRSARV